MYNPPHFTSTDPTWLDWLAEHHPFGTLVSQVENAPFASHLPVLYRRTDGEVTLTGHWAWVAIAVVSAILFLTYAKADPPDLPAAVAAGRAAPAAQTPAAGRTSPTGFSHNIQAELEALKRELNG